MIKANGDNRRPTIRLWLSILVFSAIPTVFGRGAWSSPQGAAASTKVLASPDRVTFDTRAGSAVGISSDISLSAAEGSRLSYTASAKSDGGWLQLGNVSTGVTVSFAGSVSGTAPGSLRVVAVVQRLPAGAYSGQISIAVPGATDGPAIIPVILVVRGQPTVMVRPSRLEISRRAGYDYNPTQPQTITVFGERTPFRVLVSAGPRGWLAVSPASGTSPADLTVSVDPSRLDSGFHRGNITILSADGTAMGGATVTLNLTDGSPPPSISPSSVPLQAQYGSRQSIARTISVSTNDVPLTLAGSAADVPWLSVNALDQWAGALDGKTATVLPLPGRVVISADPTGLAPGIYSGHVQIADVPAPTVAVNLDVVSSNLIVPRVVDGGGWDTVITLVNTDAVPAPYTLKFWSQDGIPMSVPLSGIGTVSSYSDEIPVGGTRTLNTTGLSSIISSGWAEVILQGSIGGTAALRQHGASGSEVAVPVAAPSGKSLTFPFDNLAGFQTGAALVNGSNADCTVAVSVYDEDGRQIVSDSITLPAHGSPAFFLQEKYPQLVNRRGEIKFESGVDISAVAMRFGPRGGFALLQPTVANGALSNDITTCSIPRISDGNGWKTTILLQNPAAFAVPFSLVFRDPATPGALLKLPVLGVGMSSEYSDVIPAGGTRTIETTGTAKPLVQGWAEIVSEGPIAGTVVLTHTVGSVDAEATMQIQPGPGERFVLPFDNSGGYATGLATLNAAKSDSIGTVIVRDESGERLDTQYFPTGGGTSQAFMLADRFQATKAIRGTLEFVGVEISVLGARFNPSGSFALVTPLPK